MRRISFITLGCKVNQYESEALAELFSDKGYLVSGEEEQADVYVINTCSVTNLSESKSRQMIRRCKKNNPKALIAVVGCYAQVSPAEVGSMPEVDIVVGTSNKRKLPELVEQAFFNRMKINAVQTYKNKAFFENFEVSTMDDKTRANIKIQDGCNQFCSYCIIPYARGPIRSRERKSIFEEAVRLVNAGYREIVLTGIHVSSYGKDHHEGSLIDVIEDISSIEGIERIRLSSMEQGILNEEFLERAVSTKKLCHHFHLSLQSGSDSVLKRMNRRYGTSEYFETVSRIRRYMPDVGLTTDIIVGFPGETEEEFRETVDFIKKVNFSKIHLFKYSIRKGTPAEKMPQVDGNVKISRMNYLMECERELRSKVMNSYIGKKLDVLSETRNEHGLLEGYSDNYIRVCFSDDKFEVNKIREVLIIDNLGEKLVGKIV